MEDSMQGTYEQLARAPSRALHTELLEVHRGLARGAWAPPRERGHPTRATPTGSPRPSHPHWVTPPEPPQVGLPTEP